MKREARSLTRLWLWDQMLSVLLLLLILRVFIIQPLILLGYLHPVLIVVVFSLILLSSAMIIVRSRLLTIIIGGVVFAALLIRWSGYFQTAGTTLNVIGGILGLIALGALALVVLLQVFREGPITLYRVQGAIVVYLLLGLMWGFSYALVELVSPGAFQFGTAYSGSLDLESRLMYFSMVTLTTVGYGDITALHPTARSLAQLEALTGQLFPSILIARLVAMELEYSRRKR